MVHRHRAKEEHIDLFSFRKGQRKEDVAKEYLAKFQPEEGVLFIGKAQEKARVVRTERRRNPKTGASYAWLVSSTAMVNHYYFYCVDRDFGPFFIKLCSYFPYNGKVCLNGCVRQCKLSLEASSARLCDPWNRPVAEPPKPQQGPSSRRRCHRSTLAGPTRCSGLAHPLLDSFVNLKPGQGL